MYHFQAERYNNAAPLAQGEISDFGQVTAFADQGLFAAGFLRLTAREEADGTAAKAGKGKSSDKPRDFAEYLRSRLNAIGRTIWDRYGGPCTDDDAIVYYEEALPFLIELAVIEERPHQVASITWASRNAPSLILGQDRLADDEDRAWFREQETRALNERFDYARCHQGRANLPNGRELGKGLAVRAAEMRTGQIRGVTPIDRTPEQLADDRRAADLMRKQSTRKPQESSPTRLKVWERVDIGQTKYKALKRAGRLPAWPTIPRGADPEPYVVAWVALYRAMHETVTAEPPIVLAA
ncbi:hypothetical protein ACRBEV_24925 [Methylobacterium phyllosphaerae]